MDSNSDGRRAQEAPKTDEDRAAAFRSMLAYSGIVDIAWDETWTGSEQVRYYRIDCDKLYMEFRRHSPSPILADDARYLGLDETVKRVLRPSFTARPRRLNYRHDSAGMRLVSAAKGMAVDRSKIDGLRRMAGRSVRSVARRPADVLLVVLGAGADPPGLSSNLKLG